MISVHRLFCAVLHVSMTSPWQTLDQSLILARVAITCSTVIRRWVLQSGDKKPSIKYRGVAFLVHHYHLYKRPENGSTHSCRLQNSVLLVEKEVLPNQTQGFLNLWWRSRRERPQESQMASCDGTPPRKMADQSDVPDGLKNGRLVSSKGSLYTSNTSLLLHMKNETRRSVLRCISGPLRVPWRKEAAAWAA